MAVIARGPGRKYCVGGVVVPFLVPHAGFTYSLMLISPSPSGSPKVPSWLLFDVGSKPFAASQPSGIPSPSVSHPSGSSSIKPSPSSSSLEQSESPSPSPSKLSTIPSLSSSNVLKHIFPRGSSSAPSELRPWISCIALSSSQSLTGTVPFHQTPLSRTFGVDGRSHPVGIEY